jgi:hypothetical protein
VAADRARRRVACDRQQEESPGVTRCGIAIPRALGGVLTSSKSSRPPKISPPPLLSAGTAENKRKQLDAEVQSLSTKLMALRDKASQMPNDATVRKEMERVQQALARRAKQANVLSPKVGGLKVVVVRQGARACAYKERGSRGAQFCWRYYYSVLLLSSW